jgi:hypothetical protein
MVAGTASRGVDAQQSTKSIARDGKIAAVYLVFDELRSKCGRKGEFGAYGTKPRLEPNIP